MTPNPLRPEKESLAMEWRDRFAEEWLIAQHSKDWYIGDATDAEWNAAYDAAYAAQSETPDQHADYVACWEDGDGSTCMLPDRHEGPHRFTSDSEITVRFEDPERDWLEGEKGMLADAEAGDENG